MGEGPKQTGCLDFHVSLSTNSGSRTQAGWWGWDEELVSRNMMSPTKWL